MSKMKMKDHFPEAFQVDHNNSFEVQDVTWYSYGEKYESNCDQDSAFGHAVLNHDRMVEEIAELREALEKSSEVLRRQLSKYYYKDEVAILNQYESNKKLLNQLKDRASGK